MRTALITGIAGQDGSYLAELLLSKGYTVLGIVRPSTTNPYHNLRYLTHNTNLQLVECDVQDLYALQKQLSYMGHVDEIYHLAALSYVGTSLNLSSTVFDSNLYPTLYLLDYAKVNRCKFYFAASSEMLPSLGSQGEFKDWRDLRLGAHSPYAASKVAAHLMVGIYRQQGLFAVSGIAYNHESRRRGKMFVTKKLADGVRQFKKTGTPVKIGPPGVVRDWHHAADTVNGMYLSLQHSSPGDYIFASGEGHTVREFGQKVCQHFNVNYHDAIIEHAISPRPWDVGYLCGNSSLTEDILGWKRTYNFDQLVQDVCEVW